MAVHAHAGDEGGEAHHGKCFFHKCYYIKLFILVVLFLAPPLLGFLFGGDVHHFVFGDGGVEGRYFGVEVFFFDAAEVTSYVLKKRLQK